jgi:hypothetical protein
MAQQSIVLLKNEKNTLPLKKTIKKIAVVGPNADNRVAVLGNYNGVPSQIVTALDGIKAKLGNTVEVVYEQAGTVVSQVLYGIPGLLSAGVIDLYFEVDPVAGKVQPKFQVQGGVLTSLGAPITLGGQVLEAVRTSKALAVGLMASSGGGASFAATWDDFEATLLTNTAVAKVTIDPPENTIPTSSTYGAGSFKVQNLSTGGQKITSVTLDLRTAMLPDVVFDPTGTAGDTAFKGFVLDNNSGVGSVNGSFASPHNGVNSQDGYDQVVVTFSGFDPGESMSFSADIDPTSPSFNQVVTETRVERGPTGVSWQPDGEDVVVVSTDANFMTIISALDFTVTVHDPASLNARAALARTAILGRNFARAETEMAALLKDAPKSATVHALNGMLEASKNNLAAARRSYERALQLSPGHLEAIGGLTYLDLAAKSPATAIASSFRPAIRSKVSS